MARGKLSERTKKQIDSLPEKAQRTFKRAHQSALKEYQNPHKRRNKGDTPEKVAHKVAWSAVKKKYTKRGNTWTKKSDSSGKKSRSK